MKSKFVLSAGDGVLLCGCQWHSASIAPAGSVPSAKSSTSMSAPTAFVSLVNPLFDQAVLKVGDGKTFTITAAN
jgi:hypothetical protein